MKFGYARVSRSARNLGIQSDALTQAGVDKIFVDETYGADRPWEGMKNLLNFVRRGDQIIIWRLDRLSDSVISLINLLDRLVEDEIRIFSLTERINIPSPSFQQFLAIYPSFLEAEKNLKIDRTRAGLLVAKANGKRGGRRRVLNPEKEALLRARLTDENGLIEKPDFKNAARSIGVSERTVRRFALTLRTQRP